MQQTVAGEHVLPEHVLVLGGTGFVGGAIAKKYLERGRAVSVASRLPRPTRIDAALEGARFECFDANDGDAVARAIDDVDHVVYALGTPFAGRADADPVYNVLATLPPLLNLLEALRTKPGVGVSFLSSGGTVYGNPSTFPVPETAPCRPITGYGVMKVAAERYLDLYRQVHGVPSRVLRVANAYGSSQPSGRGQGFLAELFRAARDGDSVTVFGDGETVRDYVCVEDVATAVVDLSALRGGPSVLNVGSGTGRSVNDVLDAFEAVTTIPVPRDRRPSRAFDVRRIVLDVSLLRSAISWEPLTLEEGLTRAWNVLRAEYSPARR